MSWKKIRSMLFIGMGVSTLAFYYKNIPKWWAGAQSAAAAGWKTMTRFQYLMVGLGVVGSLVAVHRIVKEAKRFQSSSPSASSSTTTPQAPAVSESSQLTNAEPNAVVSNALEKLLADEASLKNVIQQMTKAGGKCEQGLKKILNENFPYENPEAAYSKFNYKDIEDRQFQVTQLYYQIQNKKDMDSIGCLPAKPADSATTTGPMPASVGGSTSGPTAFGGASR